MATKITRAALDALVGLTARTTKQEVAMLDMAIGVTLMKLNQVGSEKGMRITTADLLALTQKYTIHHEPTAEPGEFDVWLEPKQVSKERLNA
jgi:hypothetical protein